MITTVNEHDIKIITSMIHELNHTHEQYNAYCSKSIDLLQKDVNEAFNQKRCLVYKHNTVIKGVILYFKTPSSTYDIIGPFVIDDDLLIAKQLLDTLIQTIPKHPMNFFFNESSAYYINLMEHLDATLNEYEYRLTLNKTDFKLANNRVKTKKATNSDKSVVALMHDSIFKDIYLTSEMLLDASRFDHVYLLLEDDKTVGYALIIPKNTTAYLEVFGIIKDYRGQGLATPFLSDIIQSSFNTPSINSVTLIVDVVNKTALNLYKKIGFTVTDALVSYTKH